MDVDLAVTSLVELEVEADGVGPAPAASSSIDIEVGTERIVDPYNVYSSNLRQRPSEPDAYLSASDTPRRDKDCPVGGGNGSAEWVLVG